MIHTQSHLARTNHFALEAARIYNLAQHKQFSTRVEKRTMTSLIKATSASGDGVGCSSTPAVPLPAISMQPPALLQHPLSTGIVDRVVNSEQSDSPELLVSTCISIGSSSVGNSNNNNNPPISPPLSMRCPSSEGSDVGKVLSVSSPIPFNPSTNSSVSPEPSPYSPRMDMLPSDFMNLNWLKNQSTMNYHSKKYRDRSKSLGSPLMSSPKHFPSGMNDAPISISPHPYFCKSSAGYLSRENTSARSPMTRSSTNYTPVPTLSTPSMPLLPPFPDNVMDQHHHLAHPYSSAAVSQPLPKNGRQYMNSTNHAVGRKKQSGDRNSGRSQQHGYSKSCGPSLGSSPYTYDPNRVYKWDLQENIKLNKILNAIAKGCKKNSCFKVEDKLLRTISKFIQGESKAMPDISSFGIAINGWARNGERGSAARAEALLHRMTSLYDCGIILSKPDARMYTTVIGAWSRSQDNGRATRAEMLLNYMEKRYIHDDYDVKPNVRTYGAVLHAFAKSGENGAAVRAQGLLNRMERMYKQGDVDVKPNVITYNAVITAHAKSRDKGRAERAESLLLRMQELYEQGNEDVKPDVVTYNSVIDAWAKAGERGSAVHAEELLNRMQELYRAGCAELKPNEQTYDIVLNAWALSGEENAARRAEEILNHMESLYQQGKNTDVRPSTVSYSSVINAWARSGEDCAPYRAEQILRHMERLYENGNVNLKPDKVLYIAVINAWGRCHEKEEGNKRIELLREQIRLLSRDRDRDRERNRSSWK